MQKKVLGSREINQILALESYNATFFFFVRNKRYENTEDLC